MEVPVRAGETSDGKISIKKSSNGESKDVAEHHSGEKRCNEERKRSLNDGSNSKANEFSLERKISFNELRKRVEEIEDAPNLSSKHGQVSLVLECKEKPQQKDDPTSKREEERKYPEGNIGKEETVNLHLSQIKIQQWTKAKAKQNDEEVLRRLKQVCGALEGDDIYHYENIDDFDDTTENYQQRSNHFKRSRLRVGGNRPRITCKYKFDENGTGMISTGVSCKGNPDEQPHEVDLRLNFIGEFARGGETIQCLQRGCTNLYDPWEVVEFVGTKQAKRWFVNNANDPLNRKHKVVLPQKKHRQNLHVKTLALPTKTKESESKRNWWKRKSKTKKVKLFELPKTSHGRRMPAFGKPVGKADTSAASEVRAQKLLKYKHECTTCLEGFNEDPELGGLTCRHYTCRPCLHNYFKEQLQNMITSIECPHLDCCERFNTSFILSVLDSVPLRVAYMNLYEKRKELGYEEGGSSSDETSLEGNEQAERFFEVTQNRIINSKVPKSSSDNWLKSSDDYKRCPGCNTLTQKCEDDEACNIVLCSFCRTKFCWVCGKKCSEAFHMYKCPLYGNSKFGKGRRIVNYVGYSAGLAVAVPVVGSLVIGTGVVALATLITIGSLSPPVLLSRKMHKYHKLHNSSATRRRLSMLGGASLGVLALPVLSLWGAYKTVMTASRKAVDILDKFLLAEDDEDLTQPTLNVATNAWELNREAERESTDDENTKDDTCLQSKQIEKASEP